MLILHSLHSDNIPVEAEAIRPDTLSRLTVDRISKLPILYGNRSVALAELFRIDPASDPADGVVRVEGTLRQVHRLGEGMLSGRLELMGSVGMHTGASMCGGEIVVRGDAGDWTGAEMRGGLIRVGGNAGDLVGSGYRGAIKGMKGGEILIDGNAGNEVGSVMRRGLIAIGGDCGAFAGPSMIAGTIAVFGRCGERPGFGLKRGSIVVLGEPPAIPAGFRPDCVREFVFVRVYLKHLRERGFAPSLGIDPDLLFRRYSGDLLSVGRGEFLVRCRE